ncbi:hypothetical protein SteCoe_2766 [Stentor coeruleus]|uniref:Uncharacterized protein n=1 Tax=Stentor coeruleus TaxID=5963 RepID=A0A1R2CYR5_9CILI|nr:hypothetical protein SteCoe_2766 [Stentor coeruleus]
METKSQVPSPRVAYQKSKAKDKSPNLKISFLPLLRESPKSSHSAKKITKSSPKPQSKKTKAKFQNLTQRNPKNSSLEDHSPGFRELNLDKKTDTKTLDKQEVKQKSQLIIEHLNKILEVKPEKKEFFEEKSIFRRRASCENPQEKVSRISEDLRIFKVENNDDEQDEGCQGVESPETLRNYGEDACLRQENEELKRKLAILEEEYCNDTNELKKNIEKEKFKSNQLKSDLEKCAGKNEILQSKCEGILENFKEKEKRYKIDIEHLKTQLKETREEIQKKNLELAQINEYMQRKRKNSKQKEQQMKDLQEKNQLIESDKNSYIKELESLKSILANTLIELQCQKSSFSSVQSQIQDFSMITIDNLTSFETLQAIKDNYYLLHTNYIKLQQDLYQLQEKSCSNEQNLLTVIEKLKNYSQNTMEGPVVTEHKLMRMKTFTSSNSIDVISQDNGLRLMKKINALESQAGLYKAEIDKLNKDLAYHKKIVEEKHGFISILEKQISSKVD